MAAADQDSGAAPTAAAPALGRQLSYTCSRGRAEPMHDRKLSYSYSFSTPAVSLSSPSPPPSSMSSFESILVPEVDRESSSSSASSYESFYQFEAAAEPGHDCFVPATQPPAVQTMMAQGQPAGAGAGYDQKRLPSSMFRTRSTCPAQWSAASNESLFSIRLGQSGEVGALYGDLYYDAAGGFHRMSSAGRDNWMLPAVSAASSGGASGGLCLKEDCARCRCSGRGMNAKSVRFTASTSVCSDSKHSPVFPTLAGALEDDAPATEAKEPNAAAEGWCVFGCCWPSPPSLWCACHGCDCRCGDCR